MPRLLSLGLLCAALVPAIGRGVEGVPPLAERAAWFQHDRFGLFIHFGVFSQIGKGEWIRESGQIPLAEYNKLLPQFNPAQFKAAEWVGLAKRAGQKYLVLITKHHDGFCLFDSRLTDYSIMHTPFKRDVVGEIAAECHRQGMRLGLYYSIMDWHHPDYLPRRPWEKDRSSKGANYDRYLDYMRGQLRELMSNYGNVDVLWFDGGWEHTSAEDNKKHQAIIDMARRLQPQILVNDRANIGGDFGTPEQFIPATGLKDKEGRPMIWEACLTLSTGHGSFAPVAWWGYDRNETVFKPTEEVLQELVNVASKGGNFLLNIGPMPNGRIRAEEVRCLTRIGPWMAKYGDSIYGSQASPFRLLKFFGRVTRKDNRLFVHVFDWPADGRLALPGLRTPVSKAYLMGEAANALPVERQTATDEVVLGPPEKAPDPIDSVIVVELAGPVEVAPVEIAPAADGAVDLPSAYAEIQAQHGQRAKLLSRKGRVYIGNWSNPNDIAVWNFRLAAPGSYTVRVDGQPASPKAVGQRVRVSSGAAKVTGKITAGRLELDQPLRLATGKVEVRVELVDAQRTGPAILDLFGVKLVPRK
jgi:alpha-L-fucosidase